MLLYLAYSILAVPITLMVTLFTTFIYWYPPFLLIILMPPFTLVLIVWAFERIFRK